MKQSSAKTTSLVHGCDIISSRLTHLFCLMGLLFKFEPTEPRKPKPLPLSVISLIILAIFFIFLQDILLTEDYGRVFSVSREYQLASMSTFVVILFKFLGMIRVIVYLISFMVPVIHHGTITNVIAQRNKIISDKEQAILANQSFRIFFCRGLLTLTSLASVLLDLNLSFKDWRLYYLALAITAILLVNLAVQAPFMYICYLGSCLGQHVKNFSEIHIDSLFDQFDDKDTNADIRSNFSETNSTLDQIGSNEKQSTPGWLSTKCRNFIKYMNSNEYPEQHEVEMNKTTGNLEISEASRISNTYLIRSSLRKTQVMLSELRDTVNDINKLGSIMIITHLMYESVLIVLITTASIQGRVYKSLSVLVIPTVTQTLSSAINFLYICTCLDETTSQLKLMINKMFDFIIINLRVPMNDTDQKRNQSTSTLFENFNSANEIMDKDDEVQSETWCQFQYTRKLAGTIHFTMGGILIVSRKMVLPILAHILSAVFISIEIMSIVDTLGLKPDNRAAHQSGHSYSVGMTNETHDHSHQGHHQIHGHAYYLMDN